MAALTNTEYELRKQFLLDLKTLSKTEAQKVFDIVKQHNTTVYVIHILLVSFGVYKYFF